MAENGAWALVTKQRGPECAWVCGSWVAPICRKRAWRELSTFTDIPRSQGCSRKGKVFSTVARPATCSDDNCQRCGLAARRTRRECRLGGVPVPRPQHRSRQLHEVNLGGRWPPRSAETTSSRQ